MNNIEESYIQIQKVCDKNNIDIECFDVVQEVEAYRLFWKPEKVNVLLLAESHVFTSKHELNFELNNNKIFGSNKYCRFVYCLGYGESTIISGDAPFNNVGTWQFWKIFYSCLNEIDEKTVIPVLRKYISKHSQRIENKIKLLQTFQDKGIWLVDTSIVGFPLSEKLRYSEKVKREILLTSWETYIKNLVKQIEPKFIVCIGRRVYETIDLKSLGFDSCVMYQPQAHLRREEHTAQFNTYFKICQKYCV